MLNFNNSEECRIEELIMQVLSKYPLKPLLVGLNRIQILYQEQSSLSTPCTASCFRMSRAWQYGENEHSPRFSAVLQVTVLEKAVSYTFAI